MDTEWALGQLDKFAEAAKHHEAALRGGGSSGGKQWRQWEEWLLDGWPIVRRILRTGLVPPEQLPLLDRLVIRGGGWKVHRSAALQARGALQRAEEMEEKLGTSAPQLRADRLHPWVWEAARPMWDAGLHRDAVHAAARSVNGQLRKKLGRTDVSEVAAVEQAFGLTPAKPGQARLRLPLPAETSDDTRRSLHLGAMHFGKGCFLALRNPVTHEEGELSEQEALEQLASWSVLSRWIDDSQVEGGKPAQGSG